MIIRRLEDILDGPCHVTSDTGWSSRRLIVGDDGMGYSVHDTVVEPGICLELHYKHHLETCYCIEGSGQITDLKSGECHALKPGTLYALDKHDRHRVETGEHEGLRLICVFNPGVTGHETHNADGSYAIDKNK